MKIMCVKLVKKKKPQEGMHFFYMVDESTFPVLHKHKTRCTTCAAVIFAKQ